MTFCVYLTHPEVRIDPDIPVPEWGLSEIGRLRAGKARESDWASSIRHVFSSEERKAIETAEIFAVPFGIPVQISNEFHENDRSSTGFLPPKEFEGVADLFFANPDVSIRGWERARDAQARIVDAVSKAVANLPEEEPVLFSGHGGVGTLLKCHLLGVPISRCHDQNGGGHYFVFKKTDLATQSAEALDWIRL